MELPPFELERWLDEYESDADLMLAESGVRSLPADRFDLNVGELGYVIPTDGSPEFRAKIAERYSRSPEEVVLTCGTQEADYLTFMSLLSEDDHSVVISPTYQSLKSVPAAIGDVTSVPSEPPNWELPVDAVAEAIQPETQLVVLTNPSNPTGKYLDPETMDALYDLVAENDAYLLVDEIYRMLADDPHPPAASLGPRAISTAGVSKSYGLAGARLGWVVADTDVANTVRKWKDYTTISPPLIGHHIAQQALGEQESEILEANRAHAKANRERVAEFADRYDLDWFEPTGVNGFLTVPDGFDNGKEFCRTLFEEESVVLAPGDVFGYPNRFRIGFGLHTDELKEGLERVGRHIEQYI
ncbi:aminotransferase class I/II-fold pyridoxal phosphate-dependent enzyme [Halococcus salsus]|uniref:aminotransferase class I/II-fold pyridoxal phosphate-dependent enzyme n=1 Tax=Halococcus salsus TaxID=2162894 RepID=UPI00135A9864|nr:aminotransferase class I/II-fold pyridoxal phosphate-dependent enzyme [Halococcus salsus]